MSENNMALLSQSEIDALIDFLNHQKGSYQIKGDILSQESINKLIEIIKTTPKIGKNIPVNIAALKHDFSSLYSDSDSQNYELTFKKEGNDLKLFAYHLETADTISITPSTLTIHSSCNQGWGNCISPITFDFIAKKLDIKYSEETFHKIIQNFAFVMYGDENADIPIFYLP